MCKRRGRSETVFAPAVHRGEPVLVASPAPLPRSSSVLHANSRLLVVRVPRGPQRGQHLRMGGGHLPQRSVVQEVLPHQLGGQGEWLRGGSGWWGGQAQGPNSS